jgi:hypothetical protein
MDFYVTDFEPRTSDTENNIRHVWLKASAAVVMLYKVFWVFYPVSFFFLSLLRGLRPWRWDRQVIPKRWSHTKKRRPVTTQKILSNITTTAEAFNYIFWYHNIYKICFFLISVLEGLEGCSPATPSPLRAPLIRALSGVWNSGADKAHLNPAEPGATKYTILKRVARSFWLHSVLLRKASILHNLYEIWQ